VLAPRLKAVASEASGFTLPELLVATVLGLLVIGSGVTVFAATMNDQPRITSESNAIQDSRVAMERVIRELRQGATVQTATQSQLSIATYVHSQTCGGSSASTAIPCLVTYTCTAGACTRTEANPDGSAPAPPVTVVSGLQNSNVFTYSPNSGAPTYVGVTFAFPADGGGNAITLSDGAATRNSASS
jgi:prepilin-type N-terminal cleavage/methylation domain-containing protein